MSIRINIKSNLLWTGVCVALMFVISALIASNTSLRQHNHNLELQLASMQQPECIARDTWAAGTTRTFTIESDDIDRQYMVHLPDGFVKSKNYPAVVYFSGKGKGAADSEAYSGYNQLPAITIYPQPMTGKDGALSWQSAPYSPETNDVAFVGNMLDQINGQLCIERSHIYAVGVSNGGGFVALLSCQMSDRIKAFGMIAGAFYPESACTPKKSAPIITMHGDNDQVVPYFGSVLRQLPDIDQWSAHRAEQNGCHQPPFITHQESAQITTWSNCRDHTSVRSIRQFGVGHAWTPADRDIIWQFLSSY